MKISTISFISFLLMSASIFGQSSNKDINPTDTFAVFHILDTIYFPRNIKTYPTDKITPNFLQVSEGQLIFATQVQGSDYYINGDIEDLKEEFDESGLKVISFFVRGRKTSAGAIMSFEITTASNGSLTIHYFNKMGGDDVYFRAHPASSTEIIEIMNFYAK